MNMHNNIVPKLYNAINISTLTLLLDIQILEVNTLCTLNLYNVSCQFIFFEHITQIKCRFYQIIIGFSRF